MSTHLRQLLVASTFALATVGAYGQSTPTTTPAAPKAQPTTQAERDYEAAKAACQKERSKTAQLECLRRADDAYNRATGVVGAPLSGKGGSAAGTATGGGSNSAKQRS